MGKAISFEKNIKKDIINVFNKFRIPFLMFLTYSFMGWVFEVIVFYCMEHQFINRGFLIGPWCSIYGYGCLIVTYGLKKYRKKTVKLFYVSFIVCSVFEYFVSYILEVIFNARWWDYSQNSLQLNGRVWLITSIFFAFLVCLIVNYVRPFLLRIFRKIPKKALSFITLFLLLIYIADTIVSNAAIINLGEQLQTFDLDVTKQVSEYIFNMIKLVFKIG
ncbi:MAG: putative ABC transporter permease [Clostridia bacterium]|nr:putative ABC transporter permease [Clostridia bacterium]